MNKVHELTEASIAVGPAIRRLDAIMAGAVSPAKTTLADPDATFDALDDAVAALAGTELVYRAALKDADAAINRLEAAVLAAPPGLTSELRASILSTIAGARKTVKERGACRSTRRP